MPEARLHITVPESVWIGELTRNYADTTFRILAALPNGETGVCLAEIHGDAVDSVLDTMAAYDAVLELDVLDRASERVLVQFETSLPVLLFAARDSGIPLETPFELRNGEVTWEVTAPSERLSALGTQLRGFGLSFSIDYIQQDVSTESLLTDTQRDIVAAAIEAGYYDTPRDCSLTELAADLDKAKSTISETLHRAEGKIMKQYVNATQRETAAMPL